jgi:hypothetical protein
MRRLSRLSPAGYVAVVGNFTDNACVGGVFGSFSVRGFFDPEKLLAHPS